MDFSTVSGIGARVPTPDVTPRHVPDLRPTADAAALSRDPHPDLPLPPSATQAAAVVQSAVPNIAEKDRPGTALMPNVTPAARLLKPYGITMLPDPPGDASAKPETSPDHGS